jgi:hypothetical protein
MVNDNDLGIKPNTAIYTTGREFKTKRTRCALSVNVLLAKNFCAFLRGLCWFYLETASHISQAKRRPVLSVRIFRFTDYHTDFDEI